VTTILFNVLGRAAPAGSKRAFAHAKTGKVMVMDANRNAAPWKSQVAAAGHEAMGGQCLLEGPLYVRMTFRVRRPKSHYGANGDLKQRFEKAWPAVKPDVLKLARGVEDGLTGVVWHDDAQIVEEFLTKTYTTGTECVEVLVQQQP